MCIFTGRVEQVSDTKIFARDIGREQLLVYEMSIALDTKAAMVLPLPVPPKSPEDAVEFIHLDYREFFADLDVAFPELRSLGSGLNVRLSLSRHAPTLVVRDVGAYRASFVPTRNDFRRLHPHFRLRDSVVNDLRGYDDWGFAVFQLKRTVRPARVHPMALRFPRRAPERLFFPTIHVHKGRVEPSAHFDHSLYCQYVDGARFEAWNRAHPSDLRWIESVVPLSSVVDVESTAGVVDPAATCHRIGIHGTYPNRDTIV